MKTSQLFALIQSRRTCYQFISKQTDPLTAAEVNLCLDAAVWAPNHRLTQPWRFWVVGQKTQQALAVVYADNRALRIAQPGTESYQSVYEKAIEKFMSIPQVILVGQQLAESDITQKEDYAACACAIQNFQLMAWQQSIGVQWSTGPITEDIRTYQALGVDKGVIDLVGALYLGKVDSNCREKGVQQTVKRKPIEEVTTFLE